MKKSGFILLFLLSATLLVAGCQSQRAAGAPAAKALVAYLNALTTKDEAALTTLSCADWESNALLELDSLQSVETHLEGLSCQQHTAADGSVTVTCQGKIVSSYGGEVQEFDLSQRTYKMVEQGGDWLVCGY